MRMYGPLIVAAAAIVCISSLSRSSVAQTRDALAIADNDSVYIDAKSFKIVPGKKTGDGAEPKLFADVVENGFLPKRRADNCEYEYQTFSRAWRAEISPHVDRQLARTVLDTTWLRQPSSQPLQR